MCNAVVGTWDLAHQVLGHLQQPDLGRQGAREAVAAHSLGWRGEGTKRESVPWCVDHRDRETGGGGAIVIRTLKMVRVVETRNRLYGLVGTCLEADHG